ncbi:MAG: 16S rRNA (uracil(1498)-N(3))-methyltransferase [Clostridiales bacterium]|nr:16S rRNA (uracil(1498)-N(3))-methyltransferase [Clostridiales bacterium]
MIKSTLFEVDFIMKGIIMLKFFVKNEQVNEEIIEIIGQDAKHMQKVLRLEVGEILNITDESRNTYKCSIVEFKDEKVICNILENVEEDNENKINISLFQCLAKFDKMDYIIQKATELGIYDVYPVSSKRVVVKLDEKGKVKKVERWQAISKEAAKQCKRTYIPEIKNVIFLKDICNLVPKYDIILVAYENDKSSLKKVLQEMKQNIQNIGIVIGPEGGFDESEIKLLNQYENVYLVSLGNRILRTETASISLISNILYEFDEI